LAFSPDGKTLASVGEGSAVRLWDVASGEERGATAGHRSRVTGLAFSPDGRRLGSASEDGSACLWDLPGGKERLRLEGHSKRLTCAAFADGGRRFATAGYDGTVRLWDSASGKQVALLDGHGGRVRRLVSCQGGRVLASSAAGTKVWLWEATTGKELGTLEVGAHLALAASPAGPELALGSKDTVVVWDTLRRKQLRRLSGSWSVQTLDYSPDGKILAAGCLDAVRLFDAGDGELLTTFSDVESQVVAVCFAGRGKAVAARNIRGGFYVWDMATGRRLLSQVPSPGWSTGLAASSDGESLATGGADSTVLVWRTPATAGDAKLSPREVAAAWEDLASTKTRRSYEGLWRLARSPAEAVGLFRERLRPEAAPDAKAVDKHISALADESFDTRTKAFEALKQLGDAAAPALRQRLGKTPDLNERKLIEELLEEAEKLPPAQFRVFRAIQVLEYIGGPDAKSVLKTLARGTPDARLTREAKASLQRLSE
jgi:WD40 repeat protein